VAIERAELTVMCVILYTRAYRFRASVVTFLGCPVVLVFCDVYLVFCDVCLVFV